MCQKKLERICRRLDAKSADTIPFVRWDRSQDSAQVSVTKVWVAGSFARGASDCGDLDLVVEAVGNVPSDRAINRVFFRSESRVRIYSGTPAENSSGIAFEEAVLIWANDSGNWAALLESIQPNSTASRFERPSDALPMRVEQVAFEYCEPDEVVRLQAEGIVQWRFTPLDAIAPVSLDQERFGYTFERIGAASKEVLSYVLGYLGDITRFHKSDWLGISGLQHGFSNRGSRIVVTRRPVVQLRLLDHLDVASIVVCPHKTSRGPNGIWEIERGQNHPMVQLLRDVHVWVVTANEEPVENFDFNYRIHPLGLDLYASKTAAEDAAADLALACDEPNGRYAVRELSGATLCQAISKVDRVSIDVLNSFYAMDNRREDEYLLPLLMGNHPKERRRYSF